MRGNIMRGNGDDFWKRKIFSENGEFAIFIFMKKNENFCCN
jgi:hypothetical protein